MDVVGQLGDCDLQVTYIIERSNKSTSNEHIPSAGELGTDDGPDPPV